MVEPPDSAARTPGSARRLFFALWPPHELAEQLFACAHQLLRGEGRAVSADKLHLTLAFLGSVDEAHQTCYEQAAGMLAETPAFGLVLDTVGFWRRSGIVWAGCSQEADAMRALVGRLGLALMECGYEPETRPYRTHLTLARHVRHYAPPGRRGGRAALVLRRERVDEIPPLAWSVREFVLAESHLGPHGSRYVRVRGWPLAPLENDPYQRA